MKHFPSILLAASALIFPYSVHLIFVETPIERTMGTAQKIFYFHVPLAWIMMLFAVICGVAAIVQLARRSKGAEALSIASAELVLLTGLGVLITGPIWGHATWGHAWTWDARQVTTGLLWLVFAAYVLVRHYGAAGSDRLAAALAVFGALDVPVIYMAVKWWNTQHPSNKTVAKLPSSFYAALWPALIALLLTCVAFLLIRMRQERTLIALDETWIEIDERAKAQQGGDA